MIIIVDIDGTIADARHRLTKAGVKPEWEHRDKMQQWLDALQDPGDMFMDPPVPNMMALLTRLGSGKSHFFYVTGRQESLRDVTKRWLTHYNFPIGILHMRPHGDWRKAGEFKKSVLEDIISKFGNLGIAIDDDHDGTTEPVYRELGLTHLKVTRCSQ